VRTCPALLVYNNGTHHKTATTRRLPTANCLFEQQQDGYQQQCICHGHGTTAI
jgi:hypothetical protein